jgi:hypothetical protein
MRRGCILALLAAALEAGCSRTPLAPVAVAKPEPVKITQFYATAPKLGRGEKSLLCYSVENAKTVWLSPPRQELTASPSRCIEVVPALTTTYTLTAEGPAGPAATQDVTVTIGPPHVKIIEVKVSALDVKRGDQLSICYSVQNAKTVEIQPIHFQGGVRPNACAMAQPHETTTYVVAATGAGGDKDEERVTVKVR